MYEYIAAKKDLRHILSEICWPDIWICGIKTFTENKIAYFNLIIQFGKAGILKTGFIKERR
jgi:hypothetical protein